MQGEHSFFRYLSLFFILLTIGCGATGGEGESGDSGDDDGTCFDCNTSEASFLHLDSEDISALLNVDSNSIQTSTSFSTRDLDESGGETEPSPIQGIDDEGTIHDALRCFTEETGESFDSEGTTGLSTDCWDAIPRIVTLAECDDYVYLVFERPFIVRTETSDGTKIEDYSDPWSPSSPFTSQLLRSSTRISEYQAGDRVERTNLEGVLFGLEINTWDRRRNIQFDDDCNLYVTAHVAGTSEDVLLKIEPNAAENDYEEVINASICYERYLVAPGGDVHYTGRTAVGSDCSGDSFYRMVNDAGVLTEITRGWWDYEFEPLADGTVVFYGPDPTQDGVPSWDSACLFEFDDTESGDDRYTALVNCTNDWWRYINDGPGAEFTTTANNTEQERCAEQFYTYRGSNAPDKILSIDRDGDGSDEICVVADTEHKRQGTWTCNICIDANTGHCENSSGMLTGDTTQAACIATTGNTWGTTSECYNDITTTACTITQPTGWSMNHNWCQDPGSSWSLTYSGLSCILDDKSVELLSSTEDTVTNAWVVGDRLIYSAVNGDGTYILNAVTFDQDGEATTTELTSGIEMYEVAIDPTADVDRILVNGLRFSDNSYVFGHYDFASGDLTLETAFTGVVDTMLIVGGN